jgi:hypothetical protein
MGTKIGKITKIFEKVEYPKNQGVMFWSKMSMQSLDLTVHNNDNEHWIRVTKKNESLTAITMVPQKANLKQMLPTGENTYTGMVDFSFNFGIKIS